MADYGLSPPDEDHLRLSLAPEDHQNAINFPAAGWPSYRTLHGSDAPAPLACADLGASPLFRSPPDELLPGMGHGHCVPGHCCCGC